MKPVFFRRPVRLLVPFIFSLFLAADAFALELPPVPEHYVNDYIGALSPATRDKIEATLAEFEKTTSNQVLVAIFDSLEGASLEYFSIKLAEKWKPGQKGRDNGVILLVFKSDRRVRIEVGYGLEGVLPDITANRIIQNAIVPNLRQGNWDAGIEKAVDDIIAVTQGEYKAEPDADDKADEKIKSLGPLFVGAAIAFFLAPVFCYLAVVILSVLIIGFPAGLIFGLGLAFLLGLFRTAFLSSSSTYSGRRGGFGGWGGGFGGGGFGGGGFGGGGFSGGGGGFGGGGSSGSW